MAKQQQIFYQDLPLNPTANSQGDITTLVNGDAIRQSINMIIGTNKGSRIFLPNYGCRIQSFLFEPYDQTTANRIASELQESITNYEQRIQLLSINVSMIDATSSYNILVVYRIIGQQAVDSVIVTLDKL